MAGDARDRGLDHAGHRRPRLGAGRARSARSRSATLDFGALSRRLEELGGELWSTGARPAAPPARSSSPSRTTPRRPTPRRSTPASAGSTAARAAVELERRVRALNPHIGAYLELAGGERLGVAARAAEPGDAGAPATSDGGGGLRIGCAEGVLRARSSVQPAGGQGDGRPRPTCAATMPPGSSRERRASEVTAARRRRLRDPAADVRGRRLDRPGLHRGRRPARELERPRPRPGAAACLRRGPAAGDQRSPDRRCSPGAAAARSTPRRCAALRLGLYELLFSETARPRRRRPGGRARQGGNPPRRACRTAVLAPPPGSSTRCCAAPRPSARSCSAALDDSTPERRRDRPLLSGRGWRACGGTSSARPRRDC